MTIDGRVEMFYDDAWNDITEDVHDGIVTVNYGRPDEHGEAVPTDVSLALDNSDARYSPLDPRSALFGKIGRGTKLRVRIGDPQTGMALPGENGSYASTPDDASLDFSLIGARIEVEPDSWRPPELRILASKWLPFSQQSWVFYMRDTGALSFAWTTDGSDGTRTVATSTAPVPETSGRLALRVDLTTNNGASGNDVRFFTASSIAGPWTQLGATVTNAGVTSVFNSTAALEIGSGDNGRNVFSNARTFAGHVFAFELINRSGAGTTVASPNFMTREPGDDSSFIDAAGRTWTLHGQATIADPSLRASVSAVSWQPAWDETANDALQSIEAAGILRRLGQGQEPLQSSLYRDLSTKDNIVAYWPMEDGEDSTLIAPAVGDQPLHVGGDVSLAAYSEVDASAPLPQFGTGRVGGAFPNYQPPSPPGFFEDQRLMLWVRAPDDGVPPTTARIVANAYTTGTVTLWSLQIDSTGALRLRGRDDEGALVVSDSAAFNMNGRNALVWLWLNHTGGVDTNWQYGRIFEGDSVAAVREGTVAGASPGKFIRLFLGTSLDLGGTVIGHVTLMDSDVHGPFWDTVFSSLVAWKGEISGDRMLRLTGEEGIPLRLIGQAADTEPLGPQTVTELLNLLEDAPTVDLGPFGERRDAPALLYRTRTDLYNQEPAITLDMSGGVISNPFDPPLDDQRVRNDVTVSRVQGSSARAVQETGPLSIQDPPDGIGGRYKDSLTINVHSDNRLASQAGWRLHLGTVDEHRIASLQIDMEHHPELQQAVLELQSGDLIRVSNPPAGLPPGPLDLIALGWSDRITPHRWRITINCAPGSPWTIGEVSDGADEHRVDTDGSELVFSHDAGTDTLMTVAVTDGPLWTTDPGEVPFEIKVSGVVLTVTAITGTTSPQTFTVDATPVNGVVKTIPSGEDVRLAHPMIVAL